MSQATQPDGDGDVDEALPRPVLSVGDERAAHLGETVTIRGQVVKRSSVRPKVTTAAFECGRCGWLERVEQGYGSLRQPPECPGCERQRVPWRFRKDRSDWTDFQKLRLQQLPEEMTNGETESMDVFLTDELARRGLESGRCVSLVAEYLPLQSGGSTVFDKAFDAEDVIVEDTEPGEFDVEPYREVIDEVAARDDPFDVLVDSVAPSHLGDRHIKEALICLLVRANAPTGTDGKDYRGQIHMFLLGDPGAGKTDFGEALVRLAPRSQKSSGNEGTSAAGLTAAITRDDFSDAEFTVTAGAIPKCSGGALFLDELDSAGDSEQNALLEAMESGQINIEKAGQKATLEAETSILAAGNPSGGHFDPEGSPAEQTNVLSPLLDRFDLIFCPREKTDPDEVEAIADHITVGRDAAQRRDLGKDVPEAAEAVEPELSTDELRAYLAEAREQTPVFASERVRETLRDWYVEVKTRIVRQETEDDREYPVTPRAVGDIARLAEASAKARLSDEIEMVDVERATRLKGRSFEEFGLDPGVEVVADEDSEGDEGGLDLAGETPTATITEIVDELTLAGADYGAPREQVVEQTAEVEDDLDREDAAELFEEMLAAETLDEVAEDRVVTV